MRLKEAGHRDVKGIDILQYGYPQMRQRETDTLAPESADPSARIETEEKQDRGKDGEDRPLGEHEQQRRMSRLQDTLKNHNIEISYNEDVNRYAIKVLDSASKEVVKEIPSEKTLEMFARMLEIEGLLVDEKR